MSMALKPNYNVDQLIDQLFNEPDLQKRRYIPDKMAKIGDWKSTDPLGKVLLDASEPLLLRNECAESLGKQGDPKALQYLSVALKDPDDELRRTVIWSIGQIGSKEGIPLLKDSFDDSSEMARRWIAKSLGRIFHPESFQTLKEYLIHIEQRKARIGNEERVIDDIFRAATSLIKEIGKKDENFWISKAIEYISKSENQSTLQACVALLCALATYCPELINYDEIVGHKSKSLQFSVRMDFLELLFKLGQTHELQLLFMNHEDLKTIAYRYLVALSSSFVDLFSVSQLQENTGFAVAFVEGLTLRRPFEISHHETSTMELLFSKHVHNLSFVQAYYEIKVLQTSDFSIIRKMLETDSLVTKALHLLSYFSNTPETFAILDRYALNKEKRIRQVVLAVLRRICSPPKEKCRPILEKIIEHERIWHMRRDARQIMLNENLV